MAVSTAFSTSALQNRRHVASESPSRAYDLRERFGRLSLGVAAGVLLAFLIASATAAAAAVIAFDDNAVPTGNNPQSFSVADCNGDGASDLTVANFDSNTADVFLNDGSGVLLHYGTVSTAAKPGGAACGDFNEDGIVDVAVSSWNDGTITTYLGDGAGGFTAAGSPIEVGRNPRSIWAADLNLDNHVDLVVAISTTSDVTVLFGDGNGAFPIVGRYDVTQDKLSHVTAATVADFNNDGFPDLAVTSDGVPSLSILLGPDFHVFGGALPSPGQLRGVAAGDLNGDPFPDLALLSEDQGLFLYTATGTGSFVLDSTIPVQPTSVAVGLADFNLDGFTDLAISYSDSNVIQIVRATAPKKFPPCGVDGSPLFCPPNQPVVTPPPLTSTGFRLGPNGQPQVVFLDKLTKTLSVVDASSPTPSISALHALPADPEALLLADVDNDGILDAIMTTTTRRNRFVQVLRGNATGGFNLPLDAPSTCGNGILEGAEVCDDGNTTRKDGCSPICNVETTGRPLFLDAADFNGDNKQDIVMVDGRGTVLVLISNGTGQFASIRTLGRARRKTAAVHGDFNGDGKIDVAFIPAKSQLGPLALFLNDGTGTFTIGGGPIVGRLRLNAPLTAADINHDGFADVIAAKTSKPVGVVTFYGALAGAFAVYRPVAAPTLKSFAFHTADIIEDGWLDLVIDYPSAPPVMLKGSPSGFLGAATPLIPATKLPGLTITDLNSDQHVDLVSCNLGTGPACTLRYGDGAGNFSPLPTAPPPLPFVGEDVRGAAAADFDNDGVVDLAGVSRESDTLTVFFRGGVPGSLSLPTGAQPGALDVSDVDGDGRPDLIAANDGSLSLTIFKNLGNRQFGRAEIKLPVDLPVAPSTFTALTIDDANGDGREDIAVTQAASNKVTLLLNNGHGGFGVTATLVTGPEPRGVAIGNFNGDDLFDLATANRGNDTISIFLSNPDGTFAPRIDISSAGIRPWDVKAPDLNQDGLGDLVVLNEISAPGSSEGSVVTLLNDGTGAFPAVTQTHVRGRDFPTKMCVGDFDGDGAQDDVAVASILSGDVMVLHGGGDGFWNGDERAFAVADAVGGISCYDANHDDRTDIAFGRRTAGDVGVILTAGP